MHTDRFSSVFKSGHVLWMALGLALVSTALLVVGLATASSVASASAPAPAGQGSASPLAFDVEQPLRCGALADSFKSASRDVVAPDEVLTYTIWLYNSDSTTVTADVLDVLPEQASYISGSISGGGVYDAISRTVSWTGVPVPPGGHWDDNGGGGDHHVVLSFAVTMTADFPTRVVNTAVISGDGETYERSAWVWLLPGHPWPPPPTLDGFKVASRHSLAPCEVLTYTIWLYNSSNTTVTADVLDVLPEDVNYVPGSVTGGGVYDVVSRTVVWEDVAVPPDDGENDPNCPPPPEGVALSFAVTATVDTYTMALNTAVISGAGQTFERSAWVWLVPGCPNPPTYTLDAVKTTSQRMLAPDEVLTYTVVLYNSGNTTVTADVIDPVPEEVNYVAGSVSGGGVYDVVSETIYWNGVLVPPKKEMSGTGVIPSGYVTLTFAVTATVDARDKVLNTATISASGKVFERHAWVLLVPERPTPKPNLAASFKKAWRHKVPPGKPLHYTIVLHNSGTDQAVADVTDLLPPEVSYIPGSATPDAVYDEISGTLRWDDVEVPAGWEVHLSFAVDPNTVTVRTLVTNTAVISADGEAFERLAWVWLLPDHPGGDHTRPVVHSLTIDEQDVLDSPTVTLHISATDDVGVRWMYLHEWEWTADPWPRWRSVQRSGWISYVADYAWTLGGENGTHFVSAWVADEAKNVSRLALRGIDFASLVRPGATVPGSGMTPYLVYYGAGVDVSGALTLTGPTGNVAMSVWYARNFFDPIATDVQSVTFSTPTTGTYIFVVSGEPGATYDLSIAPGGGPRLPLFNRWGMGGQMDLGATGQATAGGANDLLSMLTESGLDPLDVAIEPAVALDVYLPVVLR